VLAHQTSSALIPSHHPGAHQEPLRLPRSAAPRRASARRETWKRPV